jgi:serine/threonine protein kinase
VPGSIVAGKLRIVRRLGAGGMGAVYEVEHELTRHRRALKLLHAQMAQMPSVVERFLREASAAGRIGNPHIVETFDAGRLETGEPYIVMELLQGQTLAELLDSHGPLPLDVACEILTQACNAVGAAHAAGIVHRDIKPENLFLSGPERFVKILDFGVSKFDSVTTGVQGLTLEGSPIGTPYYMSPEQARGTSAVDHRSDIYALGVLLYECLTGRKPFVAETLPHLAVLIHQGKYDTPRELRPELPGAADTLISRAMAGDRTARYGSANELASAVTLLRNSVRPGSLESTQLIAPKIPPAPRPASALTPGVFTSQPTPLPRRSPAAWLLGAGALIAAAAVLTFTLTRKPNVPLGPEASAGTESPAPNTAPLSPTPPVAKVVTLVPLTDATVAPASPTARSAPSAVAARPTPSASAAPTPRSRASSFGLSEDNPFK